MSRYLEQCLDSLVAQEMTDFECIMVDDGSTDGSAAIARRYCDADSRFRLIEQANQGVSVARNLALAHSQAPYVTFIDPDDRVAPEHLQLLYSGIVDFGADVSQVSFCRVYTNMIERRRSVKECKVLEGRENILRQFLPLKWVSGYICMKMFRREVLTAPFPVGMRFEDTYVLNEWMANVNRIVLLPDTTYYYRMRRGSAVQTRSTQMVADQIKAIQLRAAKVRQLAPELVSEYWEELNIAKCVIRYAKDVARLTDANFDRRGELAKMRGMLPLLPSTVSKRLSLRTRWRLWLMRNHLDLFINVLCVGSIFSIQTRRRQTNLYI